MSAAAVVAEPASQRVADLLREDILRGRIRPGERIRQEEVAERYGASRIPVREALRILEAEGLTEHTANRGARVPMLDRGEVSMLYRIRERLEPLALIDSLPGLGAADLAAADQLQQAMADTADVDMFMTLDRQFHLLTYRACRYRQLAGQVTRLWNSTEFYRRLFVAQQGPARSWVVHAEHALLVEALGRGDAVDAERVLVGHIRRTRVELEQLPELDGTA